MRMHCGAVTLGLLMLAASAEAGGTSKSPPGRTKTISGIRWHTSLGDARRVAQGGRRRKARPVLWLRMLGDLAGKT